MADRYDDLNLADRWWLDRIGEWLEEFRPDERRMLPVESARRVVTVSLPEPDRLRVLLAGVGRA